VFKNIIAFGKKSYKFDSNYSNYFFLFLILSFVAFGKKSFKI